MLAGRKLLLADDSITIQKVVALTFADEGVEVVTVGDGKEAVEKLEEVAPDIVLADVFMPEIGGYEVCEYIKQNAKLKHIPVMLLVGSFEPFDEAEARRVGADDILTKPFQSIRRLIDKVGNLVSGKPADEVPTAELPHAEEGVPEKLNTAELEISTADTLPLPISDEPDETAKEFASVQSSPVMDKARDNQHMAATSMRSDESSPDAGDVLLELGDIGRTASVSPDEFVLDIDLDEIEPVQAFEAASSSATHAFVEPQLSQPTVVGWQITREEPRFSQSERAMGSLALSNEQMAKTQEWVQEAPRSTESAADGQSENAAKLERVLDEPEEGQPSSPIGQINLDQLSPQVIDAIARRAVERLSARVVQEIAWEVVPELAELLIKRKLEENQSQPK